MADINQLDNAEDDLSWWDKIRIIRMVAEGVVGTMLVVLALVVSFVPDPPLTLIEGCSQDQAEECLRLRDVCADLFAGSSWVLGEALRCSSVADETCAPCPNWLQLRNERDTFGKLRYYWQRWWSA